MLGPGRDAPYPAEPTQDLLKARCESGGVNRYDVTRHPEELASPRNCDSWECRTQS